VGGRSKTFQRRLGVRMFDSFLPFPALVQTLNPKPDGDLLEKGPDNQLTALARRLEEKYVSVKGDGCVCTISIP